MYKNLNQFKKNVKVGDIFICSFTTGNMEHEPHENFERTVKIKPSNAIMFDDMGWLLFEHASDFNFNTKDNSVELLALDGSKKVVCTYKLKK